MRAVLNTVMKVWLSQNVVNTESAFYCHSAKTVDAESGAKFGCCDMPLLSVNGRSLL